MMLNNAQRNANKLRNAECYGPPDRVCNKYSVSQRRQMSHLARVWPVPTYSVPPTGPLTARPPRECTYTHTHCTLHYTLGCMHC